jgi:hypothetical protein
MVHRKEKPKTKNKVNLLGKNDQSETVQAAPAQPIVPTTLESNLLDSSLELTDSVNIGAMQAQDEAVTRATEQLRKSQRRRRLIRYSTIGLLLLVGGALFLVRLHAPGAKNNLSTGAAQRYSTQTLKLNEVNSGSLFSSSAGGSVNVNGLLNVNSGLVLNPVTQPNNPVAGQLYFDSTTNQLEFYNGTTFSALATSDNVVNSIDGATGPIQLGDGLSIIDNQLTLTNQVPTNVVTSLQGQTGDLTLAAGVGISIDGTTVTNTGVLSLGGQSGDITLGTGLALSSGSLQNTGVTGLTAGTNITVTNNGNGNYTISSGSGGTISSPGGTNNHLANFTGVQTIGDSLLTWYNSDRQW